MPAAGKYYDRLEWLQKGSGGPDEFGQPTDAFESQGFLWAAIENLAGNRTGAQESTRQETTATVRLRNYPTVAVGDRLRGGQGDITWTVETVVNGDNEIILDVTAPKWSAGGGLA